MSTNGIGDVLRSLRFGDVGPTPAETHIHARARRRQRRSRLVGGSGAVVAVVLIAGLMAVRQAPEDARVATNGLASATSSVAPQAVQDLPGAPDTSRSGNPSGPGVDGPVVPEVPSTLPPTTLPGQSPPPEPVFHAPPRTGTRLYFLSNGGDLVSTRLDGTDRAVVLSGYFGVPIDVWPDGSKLLMGTTQGGGASIVSLDLTTGERRTILQRSNNDLAGVDMSPDGTRIAYSAASGRIQTSLTAYKSPSDVHIVNVDGSGDRVLVSGERPLWGPDSATLLIQYCGDGGGRPCKIKADGSGQQLLSSLPYVGVYSWSPDGEWLAGKDSDNRLSIARLDGSQKRTIGKMMGSTAAAWSPDGTRIVYERVPEGRNLSTGECGTGCDGAFGLSNVAVDGSGEFRATTNHDAHPVIG